MRKAQLLFSEEVRFAGGAGLAQWTNDRSYAEHIRGSQQHANDKQQHTCPMGRQARYMHIKMYFKSEWLLQVHCQNDADSVPCPTHVRTCRRWRWWNAPGPGPRAAGPVASVAGRARSKTYGALVPAVIPAGGYASPLGAEFRPLAPAAAACGRMRM